MRPHTPASQIYSSVHYKAGALTSAADLLQYPGAVTHPELKVFGADGAGAP